MREESDLERLRNIVEAILRTEGAPYSVVRVKEVEGELLFASGSAFGMRSKTPSIRL